MLTIIGLLILSLVILFFGAEIALSKSEKIGHAMGLSPLVIGMLLVGFGTSLPEFFVSQVACYSGKPEMALGNIIGSNIGNTFLILGLTGMAVPLAMAGREIRQQLFQHFYMLVILTGIFFFDEFTLINSLVLFFFFFYYLAQIMREMKRGVHSGEIEKKELDLNFLGKCRLALELILGFAMLYAGGELLVNSGSDLGRELGVSEYVISVIFVAFGTSFPELVTSFLACMKSKQTELIVGNILGSNIFNVAFVLSSLGPYHIKLDRNYWPEVMALLFSALVFAILNKRQVRLGRKTAFLFLMIYGGLIYYWSFSMESFGNSH